jgi:hypothetical protein
MASEFVEAATAPRRVAKKKKQRAAERRHMFPTMAACQEKYWSRPRLPLALANFTVPQYLRERECTIADSDAANSGLELFVRLVRHIDVTAAIGRMPQMHRPFMLVLPDNVCVDGDEKNARTTVDFVVGEMLSSTTARAVDDAASELKDAHATRKRALNQFYSKHFMEACVAMRSPHELAAALLVGFVLFNPFADVADALRAGAFLANAVLLAEGMAPLRAEDIRSPALDLAVNRDATAWFATSQSSSELSPDCTVEYLRTLRPGCHVCGKPGRRCTRCYGAYFCGVDCLRKDYTAPKDAQALPGQYVPRHTAFCRENQAAAKAAEKPAPKLVQ